MAAGASLRMTSNGIASMRATSSLFGVDTDAPNRVTEYGAQIESITSEYGAAFREFFDTLRSSSVDTLQYLAFRMDFSDHYANSGQ